MAMENELLLEMIDIEKSFPGVKALDHASLRVNRGEVHALIGENGAGKSTLMKVLLGVYPKDGGKVIFKGQEVHFRSPHDALNAGICMIHQAISLVPTTSIAENIWAGREKKFIRTWLINGRERDRAAQQILDELGIELDARRNVRELSVAEMQMVELARAVSYNAELIIMDEPTSSLSDKEIEILYRVIRDLSSKGTSIIFISHKLEEIFDVCSKVTVMRDAKFIAEHNIADITTDQLIAGIAGREIKDLYPKLDVEPGEVMLEVRNFNSGKTFKNINFSVRKDEILGFCGLVGAGRSEIMRAIFGIDKKDSGELLLEGKPVEIKAPVDAINNGLAMVTEDRRGSGIVGIMSIKNNISLAYLPKICNGLTFINQKKEADDALDMATTLQLVYASMNTSVSALSGGNQQKVIIGRWLLTAPKVLILDEPTRGIDVGSKSEIHRLISKLASEGMAVLMVSSELPEVMGMSDRIIVIHDGEITGEFKRGEADQETLMKRAFGTE